jgi:hypothetical protein
VLCCLAMVPVAMWGQDGSPSAGCALVKDVYHCDRALFRAALAQAKTVAVESVPANKMAVGQVTQLVGSLGKTVAGAEVPADLTFSLLKRDLDGVMIGPAGAELATLRVYGPSKSGQRGDLVWAEIYTGQPDMMWPSVVHALIEQFKVSAGR